MTHDDRAEGRRGLPGRPTGRLPISRLSHSCFRRTSCFRMTCRLLCLSLLAVLGTAEVQAQAAGMFSRLGFGARGIAMSNALVADAFGDASPYYNPALAPFTSRQHLEASAAFLSFDRELQFLQFAAPLRPRAGIAAGLIHAGVGDIDGRDLSGYHTDTYSTDEFAFFLAFGTRIGARASVGVGLQLFRSDYVALLDPAMTIGIDLGLTVRLTEALRLGLAVDDLLARYTWDTSALYDDSGTSATDAFPVRLRIGGAYRLMEGRAQIVAEYESRVRTAELRTARIDLIGGLPRPVAQTQDLRLHDARLRLGAEVRLAEPFALRAGIDRIGDGAVDAAMPSAGFMVEQAVGRLLARAEYTVVRQPYGTGAMHLLALRLFL